MNDTISVIVPFYKSQSTIKRCIDSILSQTYTDFEVLCISDGSTDNTINIINEYMNNDSRIKLIEQKHLGISYARNKGLELARGSFIQFIDSDDYISNVMFEKMITKLKETNSDIVVCDYNHTIGNHFFKNKVIDIANEENILQLAQSTSTIEVPWNKLYKKEAIIHKFNHNAISPEDEFGLINMISAKRIAWISDNLYNFCSKNSDNTFKSLDITNKATLYNETFKVVKTKVSEELATQFAYARVFDCIILELLMFDKIGLVSENSQTEIKKVFKEQHFIDSLTIKEQYGVSYNPKLSYSNELIEKFTILCTDANQSISSGELKLTSYNVMLCLFVKIFIIKNGYELNKDDLLVNMYISLDENSTEEAKYVNQLVGGF